MEEFVEAMKNFGVSTSEAEEALQTVGRYLPPFSKDDILAVKANPNLSAFQKYRLIKTIKNEMQRR